jgi:hypothetical protein
VIPTVLVVVTILSMLNLAITLTVLRQSRQRAIPMTRTGRSPFDFDPAGLARRAIPGKLGAALDANRPGWSARPGSTFVAFFAAGCHSCQGQAPRFATLDDPANQGSDVLAVLTQGDGSTDEELLNLLGHTPVIQGPEADGIAAALGVALFPLFVRIDDGQRIAAASFTLHALIADADAPQHAALPHR